MKLLLFTALTIIISQSFGYILSDTIIGNAFYTAFDFESGPDPSHGRTNYTDAATAKALNLTYATANSFILRSDYKTILTPTGPGRNSVRIRSKKTYTTHAVIFDLRHMPEGCGTWPAIWETNESTWPTGGEIDLLEGVNNQSPNAVTLHTNAGCVMPSNRTQTGTTTYLDCNTNANGGAGCGVKMNNTASFGPSFNANGGGWFALERSPTSINAWFWFRNSSITPPEIKNPTNTVSPSGWGTPAARFPNSTTCDLGTHFNKHNIIINLTFCGDWAGNTYQYSGCPSTCTDYVNNNPSAFGNAYFDIAAIRVYTY